MQYDLSKLAQEAKVALRWHGEDTLVLVDGEGEKQSVKKGAKLEVTVKQARRLLKYSHLWTLDGDEPVKHGFEKAATDAAKADEERRKKEARKAAGKPETPAKPNMAAMTDDELRAELEKRGMKVAKNAKRPAMEKKLQEALDAEDAAVTGAPVEDDGEADEEADQEAGE